MRPTSQPQSALRTPLNDVLGTEANVRILRALADAPTPISAPELTRRAQLQRSSVHRALKALEELGVVSLVGAPPHALLSLAERSPLSKSIRALFTAERARYEGLLTGLTRIVVAIRPPPLAVWIEGSVASSTDRPGDPVVVCVVDGSRTVNQTTEALRESVQHLERHLDITIEVRGRTLPDLEEAANRRDDELASAISVFGVPPAGLVGRLREHTGRRIRTHQQHDARSLARGAEIADALKQNPSLVARALTVIQRRCRVASPGERKELDEWKRILESATPARLRKILVDPGERSTRLRQTLPFLDVAKRPEGSRRSP